MRAGKLQTILQSKSVQIPLYLYRERKAFGLDTETFFVLMYFVLEGEKFKFNPTKIQQDLNVSLEQVMEKLTILNDAKLISVDVEKNQSGVMEEFISLENFWKAATKIMINEMNQEQITDTMTIYDQIQSEFGRTLSPIEYEIIGAWIDGNVGEELIQEALKEAVFNGVNNLRYIDKILYEWGKKGYKTKADVEKSREKWKMDKYNKKDLKKPKQEVFDYNWLEEDENDEEW